MNNQVVFLHGLESAVDAALVPNGRKARRLSAQLGDSVGLVPLDTSAAQRVLSAVLGPVRYPYPDYEAAFSTPVARARAAIGPETRLVIGSSFGGAVALRLLHEPPRYTGAVLLLAGAGPKLTPYTTLPPDVPALLVHATGDPVVPVEDSRTLAASSAKAELIEVEDDHALSASVEAGQLERWVERALALGGGQTGSGR